MKNSINKHAAIVLFSGGQDSTTCLFWAKERFTKLIALTFDYGQRHRAEIYAAKSIAAKAGAEWICIDAGFTGALTRNALTCSEVEMHKEAPAKGCPNTFVPGRNMFFLGIAAVIAHGRGINHIVTGVSQTDYSGYPDCRDAFIKSMNVTLNEALDSQFVIDTPLMWLDKAETWALADRLGVFDLVRNETLTCYNGIKSDGCGQCPACKLRREGLEEYLKRKEQMKTITAWTQQLKD